LRRNLRESTKVARFDSVETGPILPSADADILLLAVLDLLRKEELLEPFLGFAESESLQGKVKKGGSVECREESESALRLPSRRGNARCARTVIELWRHCARLKDGPTTGEESEEDEDPARGDAERID
jgi:hypothetical protein